MRLQLSEVLAKAERQSTRRNVPMVVVSDGLRLVTVSLWSWRKFGASFAPHWQGQMLVKCRDGITTVAVYSETMADKWGNE